MSERKITQRQEEALRLCHHDFAGQTQAEAANIMGISQPALSRLLAAAEKALPEFFPILTRLEATCYHNYIVEGWSVADIAEVAGKPQSAVYDALKRARAKGKFFPESKRKILSYSPSMDGSVKQKF